MAELAKLSQEAIDLIGKFEAQLREMGVNAVLVAYSGYAELSPDALDSIQKLEATLKEQGSDVVLIAHNK